jgi:hypothetical protein
MKNVNSKNAAFICLVIGIGFMLASSMVGCGGSGNQGLQGPAGPAGVVGAQGPQGPQGPNSASSSPDAIQTVVNNYNQYLVSQGSDPIQPGLRCTLYTVPNMPSNPCLLASSISGCSVISSSSGYATVGSFTYTGQVDQPNESGTQGFNMLPTALQALYPTNFTVTCTGYLVNGDYNWHEFDTLSDDGSLVYIGGSLVVQNDGLHGVQDVKGEKYLQAQVYSFQLNYFQGPGNVSLILNMDGSPVPAEAFWH